jgi:uncharacterized protein (TIGR03435 family)
MFILRGGPESSDPEHFTCNQAPMSMILSTAFDARSFRMSAPAWAENQRYEILAKVPPGATRDQFRAMLQGLLAERFGMQFHRETRELPGYEMVVAKGGVKMKGAEAGAEADSAPVAAGRGGRGVVAISEDRDGLPQVNPGRHVRAILMLPDGRRRISGRLQTMEDIRLMAENQSKAPVIDKTGITGTYDFNLDIEGPGAGLAAAAPSTPSDALPDAGIPAATLFSGMAEQLGLKLQAKKIPVEVVVIDRLEKTPTGN